ncbi:MAG TPA: GNAT family protein [Vineibacter sp.]|nr:GNAT family protein [Vineibacter sp.]
MAAADQRVLESERLVMRPSDDADLADLAALMADPEVAGRLYHGVLDENGARALLEDYKATWRDHGYGMWSLRRRDDDAFIGVSGLWNRDDGLGVATRIALAKAAWGQDFAGEAGRAILRFAFEVAGLERLVSITRASNPVAQRALIRIGWRLEERVEKDGRVLLRYAMTREEWLQRHDERRRSSVRLPP